MSMRFELSPRLSMQPTMTPALRQALKILQLPGMELLDYLNEQMKENPFLEGPADWERGEMSISAPHHNREKVADYMNNIPGETNTLEEDLLFQASFLRLAREEYKILHYLIGNLNERGYLELTVAEVAFHLNVAESLVEKVLESLQSLEPAGIGARDLQECLLIQVRRKGLGPYAEEIVSSCLEFLADGQDRRIAELLDLSIEEVRCIAREIKKLNPYPASGHTPFSPQYIQPDVILKERDGLYQVSVNGNLTPSLHISPYYRQLLHQGGLDGETEQYLREHWKTAQWMIKSIEQRRSTLQRVSEAIFAVQQGFFGRGIEGLKPLTLRQVAHQVGVHESTVSRAVHGKYAETPGGVLELKFFFGGGFSAGDGQVQLSVLAVKKRIQELIAGEDRTRPFSDQKMADLLVRQGIEMSRRTVAKYREELGIPSSGKRKKA